MPTVFSGIGFPSGLVTGCTPVHAPETKRTAPPNASQSQRDARGTQAQVLPPREADKRLGATRHSRDATLPLMFFGTLEIAWLQPRDTLQWSSGCAKGHHRRLKPASLVAAVEQARSPDPPPPLPPSPPPQLRADLSRLSYLTLGPKASGKVVPSVVQYRWP